MSELNFIHCWQPKYHQIVPLRIWILMSQSVFTILSWSKEGLRLALMCRSRAGSGMKISELSKHLKGQLGPRVSDVMFFDQRKSVTSRFWTRGSQWRHIFRPEEVSWGSASVTSRFWNRGGQLGPRVVNVTAINQMAYILQLAYVPLWYLCMYNGRECVSLWRFIRTFSLISCDIYKVRVSNGAERQRREARRREKPQTTKARWPAQGPLQ